MEIIHPNGGQVVPAALRSFWIHSVKSLSFAVCLMPLKVLVFLFILRRPSSSPSTLSMCLIGGSTLLPPVVKRANQQLVSSSPGGIDQMLCETQSPTKRTHPEHDLNPLLCNLLYESFLICHNPSVSVCRQISAGAEGLSGL